eukprot:GHVU01128665.1.p1 GENE.GHVU01128665.1~~GHVU01128665.1.p1  ORF type:complete len:156 (-),score=8.28 GHVU01128665.1:175-642(-)
MSLVEGEQRGGVRASHPSLPPAWLIHPSALSLTHSSTFHLCLPFSVSVRLAVSLCLIAFPLSRPLSLRHSFIHHPLGHPFTHSLPHSPPQAEVNNVVAAAAAEAFLPPPRRASYSAWLNPGFLHHLAARDFLFILDRSDPHGPVPDPPTSGPSVH